MILLASGVYGWNICTSQGPKSIEKVGGISGYTRKTLSTKNCELDVFWAIKFTRKTSIQFPFCSEDIFLVW